MKTITCEDCSTERRNAAYSNTRYCKSCRLLRDLLFVDDATRPCKDCRKVYAPVSRRDTRCGGCNYGSVHTGRCAFCKLEDAELHRAGIPVCLKCIRLPTLRRSIIAGLRKGQAERRQANNHVPKESR